jgi:sphingomyelin phosphodiesterase
MSNSIKTCDTPWVAVEDTLRRIRDSHPNVDIIYHTGDIVDHGVWETTEQGNIQIMDRVFNLFKEYFPNTRIYHVLGNHEGESAEIIDFCLLINVRQSL